MYNIYVWCADRLFLCLGSKNEIGTNNLKCRIHEHVAFHQQKVGNTQCVGKIQKLLVERVLCIVVLHIEISKWVYAGADFYITTMITSIISTSSMYIQIQNAYWTYAFRWINKLRTYIPFRINKATKLVPNVSRRCRVNWITFFFCMRILRIVLLNTRASIWSGIAIS